MSHPSDMTSEEALRYLIECSLMTGTNAAKAGAIERLRTDIKMLTDMRSATQCRKHQACARSSGHGGGCSVMVDSEPMLSHLTVIRKALYSGQISAAKVDAQRAFEALCVDLAEPQRAHAITPENQLPCQRCGAADHTARWHER